jgi:hypothetical protein
VISVKLAQLVTALIAIVCIAFGYGTPWFAVGMLVGVVSLVLDGLRRALRNDPTENRGVRLEPGEAAWLHYVGHDGPVVEVTHYRPAANYSVIRGGRRPHWAAPADGACPLCDHPYGELTHACVGDSVGGTWPFENGAPE